MHIFAESHNVNFTVELILDATNWHREKYMGAENMSHILSACIKQIFRFLLLLSDTEIVILLILVFESC